jgi:hypothetical protein
MPKEKVKKELLNYISKLDENEQADLLDAIKNRELLKQASELDSKQKAYNKGKKLPTMFEIVKVIRNIRGHHAKKAA